MNDTDSENDYGGGILGYLRGTQSLASAFWITGVLPALFILVAVSIIGKIFSPDFLKLLIITFLLTLTTRCFAWFSIFRCIGNTDNTIWSVLAGTIVTIDILHKLLFWSVTGLSYHSTLQAKARISEERRLCGQELHKQSGFPEKDISVQHFKSHPDDEEPYYLIYVFGNGRLFAESGGKVNGHQEYKCRVRPQAVSIERRRF